MRQAAMVWAALAACSPAPLPSAPAAAPAQSASRAPDAAPPTFENPGFRRFTEPLPADAAAVSPAEAQRLGQRSLSIWSASASKLAQGYAYLRSVELAPGQHRHTVLRVQHDQVVQRRCFSGPAPALSFERRPGREPDPTLLFDEQGVELGTNPGCHPALSVEQLHVQCSRIIAAATSPVRLMLHRDGVLAACAAPSSRCGVGATDCVTLRWAYAAAEETPCVLGPNVYPHLSVFPSGRPECECHNGRYGCQDIPADFPGEPRPLRDWPFGPSEHPPWWVIVRATRH